MDVWHSHAGSRLVAAKDDRLLSSMRTHAFDLPDDDASACGFSPDRESEGWGVPSDSADEALSPAAAAECFLDILLGLYFESSVSAEVVSTLCFYASAGGLGGQVSTFAAKPGQSSGNYSRHLKKKLGFDRDEAIQYTLDMPGRGLHGLSRASVTIPVKPVHEALLKDVSWLELLSAEHSCSWRIARTVFKVTR